MWEETGAHPEPMQPERPAGVKPCPALETWTGRRDRSWEMKNQPRKRPLNSPPAVLGTKLAGHGEKGRQALTWLRGLLAHMLSFHGPDAPTKHDGLDPLTPLAVWELEAQGAGEAWSVDIRGRGAESGHPVSPSVHSVIHSTPPGTRCPLSPTPPASPASTGSPNLLP